MLYFRYSTVRESDLRLPRRVIVLLVGGLAGLGAVAARAQSYFVEDSTNRFPQPEPNQYSNGVDIADVDGDGDLDILYANGSGYNAPSQQQTPQLYINDGTGHFTDESGTRLAGISGYTRDMDFGDIDGDGDLDIVVANTYNTQQRVLINNADGMHPGFFADETAARFPTLLMYSEEVSLADVDNDGDLDLYFCNGNVGSTMSSAQDQILINDGTGHFTSETASRLPIQNLINAQDVDWADTDGDLDLDAIIGHRGATVRLYRNDGTGHFTDVTAGNIPSSGSTYAVGVADIDGDIDLDILTVNGGAGSTEQVFCNDGAGHYTDCTSTALPSPNNPAVDDNDVQFYDVDNDGDLDFVIAAIGGASERLYRNNGSGVFTLTAGAFTALTDTSLDLAIGDLDGDGKLDLATAQGESGSFRNRLYMNNGTMSPPLGDTRAPTIPYFTDLVTVISNPNGYVVRAAVRDAITGDNGAFFRFVRLNWSVQPAGPSGMVAMRWSGGDIYRGVIPPQAAGSTVQYSVTARDTAPPAGNEGTSAVRTFTIMGVAPTIVSSTPPNGFVDVFQDMIGPGMFNGVSAVTLTFSQPVVDAVTGGALTPASFSVALTSNLSGLPAPPAITSVTPGAANAYLIALDRPIIPGAWTTLTANVKNADGILIDPAARSVDLGFLPADINRNGTVSGQDVLSEVFAVNLCTPDGTCGSPPVVAEADVNRNANVTGQDVLRVIQLINGTNTQNVWNGVTLPPQP